MRRVLLLLACLLLAQPVCAQIAFDAAAGGDNGLAAGNYDFTGLTVGSSTNRILLACTTGDATAGNGHITGLTWDNGGTNQAMTQVGSGQIGSSRVMTMWILVAPTSGNKTLHVAAASADHVFLSTSAYSGAKQTGQPDSHADHAGVASPATGTTTVVASSSWLVMCASGESGSTSAGTSTTQRAGDGFAGNLTAIMDSNGTVGTGAQSLNATSAGNIAWNIVSIAPAAGGGGGCAHNLASIGAGCLDGPDPAGQQATEDSRGHANEIPANQPRPEWRGLLVGAFRASMEIPVAHVRRPRRSARQGRARSAASGSCSDGRLGGARRRRPSSRPGDTSPTGLRPAGVDDGLPRASGTVRDGRLSWH